MMGLCFVNLVFALVYVVFYVFLKAINPGLLSFLMLFLPEKLFFGDSGGAC